MTALFTDGAKGDAAVVHVHVAVQVKGCCGGERVPVRRAPGLISELAAIVLDWIEAGGRVIGALGAQAVILCGRFLRACVVSGLSGVCWLIMQALYLLRLCGALNLWALARTGDGFRWVETSMGGSPSRLAPCLLPPWMRTGRPLSAEARVMAEAQDGLDVRRGPGPAQLCGRRDSAIARSRELRLPEGS